MTEQPDPELQPYLDAIEASLAALVEQYRIPDALAFRTAYLDEIVAAQPAPPPSLWQPSDRSPVDDVLAWVERFTELTVQPWERTWLEAALHARHVEQHGARFVSPTPSPALVRLAAAGRNPDLAALAGWQRWCVSGAT